MIKRDVFRRVHYREDLGIPHFHFLLPWPGKATSAVCWPARTTPQTSALDRKGF
jgi:hypothetical protein